MSIILLAFKNDEISDEYLRQIQALAPNMQAIITQDRAKIEAILDEVEIAVCSFPQDLIEKAPNLRWYQNWHAGVEWVRRYPALAEKEITITNASGVHAVPISEHIMALLLALGRGLQPQIHNQLRHHWRGATKESIFELAGKTMLLIGVGAIGSYTAKLATAFGMDVIGIRRNPTQTDENVSQMFGPEHLHDALPQADFVVLTIPLTPETEGLIGETEFKRMKPGAYIINIGRGRTIDQAALLKALKTGQIAGAGLDVTDPEPLPMYSQLWDVENVIITAHYAGLTPRYTERAMAIFLDNLERYVAGKPLRNVIDKRLGY